MRSDGFEVLEQAARWREAGLGVALATVVETWGSSPRPAGSLLAMNERSAFVGSVSGGCVEAAVIEEGLRAIGDGQLSLAYQPLYELNPHRLNGFEALMRWTHPTRGVVSPGVFITLAEECGCIEALTQWALDEAIRQHALWTREMPQHAHLVMHVNVSGRDLSRPNFVPHIRTALQRQYEQNSQSNSYVLGEVARAYQYGNDIVAALNMRDRITALEAADLQQAARSYLDMRNYVKVTLMPEVTQ